MLKDYIAEIEKEQKFLSRNTYSISKVASFVGVKKSIIEYWIECGFFHAVKDRVLINVMEKVAEYWNSYITFNVFARQVRSGQYNGALVKARNALFEYLEENNYFDINVTQPENMELMLPDDTNLYFNKTDAGVLEKKCQPFFEQYGLTESEKVNQILSDNDENQDSKRLLRDYIKKNYSGDTKITPSITEAVERILAYKNILECNSNDIETLNSGINSEKGRLFLVNFARYVSKEEKVDYGYPLVKKKESKPVIAYTMQEYAALSDIIFNEEYIKNNALVEKALAKPLYAEMWLYLAAHYLCDWRNGDICNDWVYIPLTDSHVKLPITTHNLEDKILRAQISDELYSKFADYSVNAIRNIWKQASKTFKYNPPPLIYFIIDALKPFFGRLLLIAEVHHSKNINVGYMNPKRCSYYTNWVNLRDFFGNDINLLFGNKNIESTRLAKSFMQGTSVAAFKLGLGTIGSISMAAYSRSHLIRNTTVIYTRDHNLTGEDAEFILEISKLMEPISGINYVALQSICPPEFTRLSLEAKAEKMQMLNLDSYKMEIYSAEEFAQYTLEEAFIKGNEDKINEILRVFYEVSQGRAQCKDDGIYCRWRALGNPCAHPDYASGLAEVCEHVIFTERGVRTLLNIIREFYDKSERTGDQKYRWVANNILFPRYRSVIEPYIKKMSKKEKKQIREIVEEILNE